MADEAGDFWWYLVIKSATKAIPVAAWALAGQNLAKPFYVTLGQSSATLIDYYWSNFIYFYLPPCHPNHFSGFEQR